MCDHKTEADDQTVELTIEGETITLDQTSRPIPGFGNTSGIRVIFAADSCTIERKDTYKDEPSTETYRRATDDDRDDETGEVCGETVADEQLPYCVVCVSDNGTERDSNLVDMDEYAPTTLHDRAEAAIERLHLQPGEISAEDADIIWGECFEGAGDIFATGGGPLMTAQPNANARQPIQPGDVFGECPKCGEMWERTDNRWTCDHCGYTREAKPDGTLKPPAHARRVAKRAAERQQAAQLSPFSLPETQAQARAILAEQTEKAGK